MLALLHCRKCVQFAAPESKCALFFPLNCTVCICSIFAITPRTDQDRPVDTFSREVTQAHYTDARNRRQTTPAAISRNMSIFSRQYIDLHITRNMFSAQNKTATNLTEIAPVFLAPVFRTVCRKLFLFKKRMNERTNEALV